MDDKTIDIDIKWAQEKILISTQSQSYKRLTFVFEAGKIVHCEEVVNSKPPSFKKK